MKKKTITIPINAENVEYVESIWVYNVTISAEQLIQCLEELLKL